MKTVVEHNNNKFAVRREVDPRIKELRERPAKGKGERTLEQRLDSIEGLLSEIREHQLQFE